MFHDNTKGNVREEKCVRRLVFKASLIDTRHCVARVTSLRTRDLQ